MNYSIQKKCLTAYKQMRGFVKRNKTIFSIYRLQITKTANEAM